MLEMQRNMIQRFTFLFAAVLVLSLSACGGSRDFGDVLSRKYDANGNLVSEEIDDDGDGKTDVFKRFAYDAKNRLVEEIWKDGGGDFLYSETTTYDGVFDVVLENVIEHYGDDPWASKSRWSYDGEGRNLYRGTDYDWRRDGTIDRREETFLEYDTDGDLVKTTDSIEETKDGATSKTVLTETYDDNGAPLRLERDLDGDGTTDSVRVFLYDEPECDEIHLEDSDADGAFDHKYDPCSGREIF